MSVPVVVLAGGTSRESARAKGWPEHRAFGPIGGRPLLAWVLEALRACEDVDRVTVVAPEQARSLLSGEDWIESGGSMWDNVSAGLRRHPDGTALLCGCDAPLLTAEAISDVVRRGLALNADFVYPIVRREDNEARCPGLRRTWATLRDGTFTGGNLMLVNGPALLGSDALIRAALAARKNPLALVRLLRPSPLLIARVLAKRAGIAELERAVGAVLNARARALITPFAEVSADLDDPAEVPAMESLMRARGLL